LCAGYVDDICYVNIDDTPTMIGLFDGEKCVVKDSKLCAQVHVNADKFAINPEFACKVVVSKFTGFIVYCLFVFFPGGDVTARYIDRPTF